MAKDKLGRRSRDRKPKNEVETDGGGSVDVRFQAYNRRFNTIDKQIEAKEYKSTSLGPIIGFIVGLVLIISVGIPVFNDVIAKSDCTQNGLCEMVGGIIDLLPLVVILVLLAIIIMVLAKL